MTPPPDALPMVTAAALAIEAMATGLVMDALNDVRAPPSPLLMPGRSA